MPSHTPSGKYLEDALASATSFGNCDTAVIRRPSSTSRDAQFVFRFWSGARDLNPGPHGPKSHDSSSKHVGFCVFSSILHVDAPGALRLARIFSRITT